MDNLQEIKNLVNRADKLIVDQDHLQLQLKTLNRYKQMYKNSKDVSDKDITVCIESEGLRKVIVPLSEELLDKVTSIVQSDIERINNELLKMFK